MRSASASGNGSEDSSPRATHRISWPIIGFGSPDKADTFGVHGSPLGPDEVIATKEYLAIPTVPPEGYEIELTLRTPADATATTTREITVEKEDGRKRE